MIVIFQVPDERKTKHRYGNKVATFLLIYSPKKGTLEIFTVQQGTKIVTFSASKYSKLLYITHGLMGFTTTSKSRYVCQYTCVFLDNDGQIREIFVPFHFALAEKSSIRARDIHLHKKLRQLIKANCPSGVDLDNEIFHICTELKTVELRQQTLEMLLKHQRISAEVLARCLQHFLDDPSEGDAQSSFRVLCTNAKSMLELYLFAVCNSDQAPENDKETDGNNKLNLEERDLQGLQKLLDLATATQNEDLNTPRVRFFSDNVFTVSSFLECFDLTSPDAVQLKPNTEELELFKTSEVNIVRSLFLFKCFGWLLQEQENKVLESFLPGTLQGLHIWISSQLVGVFFRIISESCPTKRPIQLGHSLLGVQVFGHQPES